MLITEIHDNKTRVTLDFDTFHRAERIVVQTQNHVKNLVIVNYSCLLRTDAHT